MISKFARDVSLNHQGDGRNRRQVKEEETKSQRKVKVIRGDRHYSSSNEIVLADVANEGARRIVLRHPRSPCTGVHGCRQ